MCIAPYNGKNRTIKFLNNKKQQKAIELQKDVKRKKKVYKIFEN